MVELRDRVEKEMTNMINELDMEYLRNMQAQMHRCAAKCCENKDYSLERVQDCIKDCSSTLTWAQSYVQSELSQLENKLQRCVMDCNDEVRVKVGDNPTDADIQKFTAMFDNCAKNCVDKQFQYMPSLLNKIKGELAKKKSKGSNI